MKEHKLLRVFWEILLGAFLLMPLIVTLIYSFVKRWTGVLPEGLTLQYYLAAVTNQSFLLGIFRGLVISALPGAFDEYSILLALYVALVYLPIHGKMDTDLLPASDNHQWYHCGDLRIVAVCRKRNNSG